MAIQTYNQGKFYAYDTSKKSIGEYDYNPTTYEKYQQQGLLADPTQYTNIRNEEAAKYITGVLLSKNAQEVMRLGDLGGGSGSARDQATRYLLSNPNELNKYLDKLPEGYRPPTGTYTPDTAEFISGLAPKPIIEGKSSVLGADYQLTPTKGAQAGMTLTSLGGAGFTNPAEQAYKIAASKDAGTSDSSKWSIAQPQAEDQSKSAWTQDMANQIYSKYTGAGYTAVEALNRVKELSGFTPVDAGLQAAMAREKAGTANKADKDNLAYARSKGLIPKGETTIAPATSTNVGLQAALDREKKGWAGSESSKTTDQKNLEYARSKGLIPATEAVKEPVAPEEAESEPVTGAKVMEALGLGSKSEGDYLAEAMDSPEFDWFMKQYNLKGTNVAAQAEAAQDMLDSKYASDKANLEQKLSANGLAFSGIRASQVAGLAANLAASKLEIDRKMAMQVLDLDDSLMDTILSLVSEKVKEASEGKKEALGMLEDMGLTINPITGELTPTLAARTADLSAAREERVATTEQLRLQMEADRLYKPTVHFETANGRRLMITTDVNGNIVGTIDMGSAYKGDSSGDGDGSSDSVDTWAAAIINSTNDENATPVNISNAPSGIRDKVLNRVFEIQKATTEEQAKQVAAQESTLWNKTVDALGTQFYNWFYK